MIIPGSRRCTQFRVVLDFGLGPTGADGYLQTIAEIKSDHLRRTRRGQSCFLIRLTGIETRRQIPHTADGVNSVQQRIRVLINQKSIKLIIIDNY